MKMKKPGLAGDHQQYPFTIKTAKNVITSMGFCFQALYLIARKNPDEKKATKKIKEEFEDAMSLFKQSLGFDSSVMLIESPDPESLCMQNDRHDSSYEGKSKTSSPSASWNDDLLKIMTTPPSKQILVNNYTVPSRKELEASWSDADENELLADKMWNSYLLSREIREEELDVLAENKENIPDKARTPKPAPKTKPKPQQSFQNTMAKKLCNIYNVLVKHGNQLKSRTERGAKEFLVRENEPPKKKVAKSKRFAKSKVTPLPVSPYNTPVMAPITYTKSKAVGYHPSAPPQLSSASNKYTRYDSFVANFAGPNASFIGPPAPPSTPKPTSILPKRGRTYRKVAVAPGQNRQYNR